MISFKNKKIPLSTLLISIVLIIFISILKEKKRFPKYNSYGAWIGYKRENVIRFLDIQLSYNNTLFYLFISVIVSILALIFLDDDFLNKKTHELKRRFSSVKAYKLKISNLLKTPINRIIIGIVALFIILLFIAKCNKPKNTVVTETSQETIDTVVCAPASLKEPVSTVKIDSAVINKTYPVKKTDTNNTIDPFNLEELHKVANTGIGKTISEAREKFTPNAQIGDLTGQGIDTDQLDQLEGNGSSTLNSSTLEAARSKRSK